MSIPWAFQIFLADTNIIDAYGRYPHSIEVIVDGGDETEIAQQILNTKAGGISTFGSVEIRLLGDYEDEVLVRFNRPTYIRAWFHIELTIARNATLSSNYAVLIRNVIVARIDELNCGDDVIPQNLFLGDIYSQISGVGYVDVKIGTGNEKPTEYSERSIYTSVRERCITDDSMIEVVIIG